ncbi:MAG: redoxin domain-containing protein [Nitrosopumilus sp.]|nr:redoxin domain-containing protein [Nitrosopumilus sp.]
MNKQHSFYQLALDSGTIFFNLNIEHAKKITIGNNQVFVEQENEVVLKLDSSQNIIEVNSRYPGNYIMYEKLSHLNTAPEISDPESAEDVQLGYRKVMEDRVNLIEEVKQENNISEAFYNHLQAEIKSRYLSAVYYILNKKYKDSISFPSTFTSDFTEDYFKDSNNLSSMFYAFALDDYASFISKTNSFTTANYVRKKNTIIEHFEGLQKEFLLTYMFRNYSKKQEPGFANMLNESYVELLKEEGGIRTPEYIETINYYYHFYNKANKPIPTNIMNQPLIISDLTRSLESILKNGNSNKILLFWASWCSPCIKEIMELKEKYPGFTSSRFDFVFISTDEDVSKFRAMEKKLSIRSYRVGKNAQDFTEFFDLIALPQHVLYQDGLIKDLKFDLRMIY